MNNKIKDFFDTHISPLPKRIESGEFSYLDLEFDKAKDSYFTSPVYPQYLYLNNISFESEQKLRDYLNELWKDQPALLNLIPDLLSLAIILKEEHKEHAAELSPFVYAMF
jgi:hypothetical protein